MAIVYAPHFSLTGLILLVLYVFVMRCTASTTDDLCKAVALAVVDALHAAHIEGKVAADYMGLHPGRMYQQLRGEPEHPIAVWRLLRLPLPFWMHFAPWLLYRVGQQRMQEVAETIRKVG